MEKNNNLKKTFVIVAYVVLLLSGFLKFINISNTELISTFKVKGFAIVLFMYCLLLYSTSTRKKILLYVSYLIVFAGYCYTFYSLYTIYDNTVKLEIGFYLYAFSFLVFFISLFMGNDNQTQNQYTALQENLSQDSNVINKYAYGKYLYGIDDKKEYSNHRCAIATINNNDLLIIFSNEKTANFEIKNNQIEKITSTISLAMRKSNEDPAANANEDRMLAYALGGVIGLTIADNIDNRDFGGKVDYAPSYLVEVQYRDNEEEKRIVMILDRNPNSLFKCFGERFEKR